MRPAHANHHRLAVHDIETGCVMAADISGNLAEAALSADNRFKLRPFGFEAFLALDLLAFGGFLEIGVDAGPLGVAESQTSETALVVDRHRRLVLHGTLDIVDAYVVTENSSGVSVGELDGSSGEANERSVGQGVAHMSGETVHEVVLAAMGFIGDHDDVAPIRQQRMPVAPVIGQETSGSW